jgi:hypothetical protein
MNQRSGEDLDRVKNSNSFFSIAGSTPAGRRKA